MSSKKNQIFITKLPRDITDEEVRKAFKKFGKVREVSIKRNYTFVVSFVLSKPVRAASDAGI
jgi:RNA recognition motif-containing protein